MARFDVAGLLGKIGGLPNMIGQGLLGPQPVNPALGLDPSMVQQARQQSLQDLAMGLMAGGPGMSQGQTLMAATQNARQGFQGRVFDALKEQELIRINQERARQQKIGDEYLASLPEGLRPIASAAGTQSAAQAQLQAMLEGDSGQSGPGWGNVNPGDFTPDSLAKYRQSGDFRDLVRWVTPPQEKVVVISGVPSTVQGGQVRPLSTLEDEADARRRLAEASTTGQGQGQFAVDAPKREEQRRQSRLTIDNTKSAIKDARELASKEFTTGFVGSQASKVPGTKAYDLQARINTIKANVGFSQLAAMRAASPTGGALGQVAVQELEMLQSVIASLDNAQSQDQLLESLNRIDRHMDNWWQVVKEADQQPSAKSDPLGLR